MHELALVESVIEMVTEHAQGRCIRRVKLEIGKFTCVMP
ncbi:MAG: hydrogenase/urease maturation nickel metallochaperone HypA, partial [Stellaceae bacterium]